MREEILKPIFLYLYNTEIWLTGVDLYSNPSKTQNFVRIDQGIVWPAGLALPLGDALYF